MAKRVSDEAKKLIDEVVKIRKNKGITQQDIAYRTGLKQQQISKIETLKVMPTIDTLVKYLNDLDCEIHISSKN